MSINYGDGGTSAAGRIVQVVQKHLSFVVYSNSSGQWNNVNYMNESITPTNSGNQIWVQFNFHVGSNNNGNRINWRVARTGLDDCSPRGDADGSRLRCFGSIARSTSGDADPIFLQFIDSPNTTSQMSYQLQNWLQVGGGSYAFYNREGNDANSSFVPRCASTIILMEIAA